MSMNRNELTHLVALLGLGVLARAVLFDYVGIWGDFGFYVYDARLILEGNTLFVDMIGRSPLFNYTYAWLVGQVGHAVPLLRIYISTFWLLGALPVYGLARDVYGHRAGLAAGAVLLLSPFALVYGMWANTQSLMALLAITAIYIAATRDGVGWYAIVGVLLGMAFLSRRSVVTIAGGLALWMGYRALRSEKTLPYAFDQEFKRGLGVLGGFAVAIFSMYLWLANGHLGMMWKFFDTHAVGLFSSSGRGGFPLISESEPPVTQTLDRNRIPVFNAICQLCGAWTARTFAKTTLVTTPIVGPLFYYGRDISDAVFERVHKQYVGGILSIITLYALSLVIRSGYYTRVLTILSLVLFAIVAFRFSRIKRSILYHQTMVLQLLVLFGLTAGYLYRNRLLHTYYFMDFVPFLSVVSGVLYARAWEVLGDA